MGGTQNLLCTLAKTLMLLQRPQVASVLHAVPNALREVRDVSVNAALVLDGARHALAGNSNLSDKKQ